MSNFTEVKRRYLDSSDKSRKGSIDSSILDIVNLINEQENFVTTSSCSGRIVIFSSLTEEENRKSGCRWLLVSHDKVTWEEVKTAILEDRPSDADISIKFEAFILHVLCHSLEDATKLHQLVLESGFKNSGLTVGKKRQGGVVLAVRSILSMETPLSRKGDLLASDEMLELIVDSANCKQNENVNRINRLRMKLKEAFPSNEKEPDSCSNNVGSSGQR